MCHGPTRRRGSRRRTSTTPDRSCQPDGESLTRRSCSVVNSTPDDVHRPRRTGRASRTVSPPHDGSSPWSPQGPGRRPSTTPDRSCQPDGESLTRRSCSVVTSTPDDSINHAGQVVSADGEDAHDGSSVVSPTDYSSHGVT